MVLLKTKTLKSVDQAREVSGKTPKTWREMSPAEKKKAVAEKKRVGMGKKTSSLKRKK